MEKMPGASSPAYLKLVLHFEKCRFCIFLMRSWKYSGIAANAAMPAIVFSFAIYPFTEPPVIPST